MSSTSSPLATSVSRVVQLLLLITFCALNPHRAHGEIDEVVGDSSSSDSSSGMFQRMWKESMGVLSSIPSSTHDDDMENKDDILKGKREFELIDASNGEGSSGGGMKFALRRFCVLGFEGAVMLSVEAMSFDVTCLAAATLGLLPLDGKETLLLCAWRWWNILLRVSHACVDMQYIHLPNSPHHLASNPLSSHCHRRQPTLCC
jgi:hypothetical protein